MNLKDYLGRLLGWQLWGIFILTRIIKKSKGGDNS